jgi:predicted anti-sigma-YlaC factor YlaD
MKEPLNHECDEVLVAVMARLDGETTALAAEQIDVHLAACSQCREALVAMTSLQRRLTGLTYGGPQLDLWPEVGRRIGHESTRTHGWVAFALVAAVCILWRTCQLLLDLPLPVLNAVVPLTLSLLLARWLVGDPLAISETTPDLRQERA